MSAAPVAVRGDGGTRKSEAGAGDRGVCEVEEEWRWEGSAVVGGVSIESTRAEAWDCG